MHKYTIGSHPLEVFNAIDRGQGTKDSAAERLRELQTSAFDKQHFLNTSRSLAIVHKVSPGTHLFFFLFLYDLRAPNRGDKLRSNATTIQIKRNAYK